LRIVEDRRSHVAPVDGDIRAQDAGPELAHRVRISFASRFDYLMTQFIIADQKTTQIGQCAAHEALAAGQAATQCHAEHKSRRTAGAVPPTPPYWPSASRWSAVPHRRALAYTHRLRVPCRAGVYHPPR